MAHAETPSLKRVQIKAPDGVTIDGAVVMPARPVPGRKYPAIAFAAAWNGGYEQNTAPALKLASKGYIVHLYTMRGMAKYLDGQVNMAGPLDRMDMSAVIDWLIANRPVDPDRIGAAGISYGAGLALIASGFDPRIRSVVSLSGWTDLNRALWPNETRNAWAAGILYKSAVDASRVGPDFLDIFHRFFRQERIEDNLAFGAGRSAQTYIDEINANKPGDPDVAAVERDDLPARPDPRLLRGPRRAQAAAAAARRPRLAGDRRAPRAEEPAAQ
ncbi:CocE/NonD family hydrolase [Svornostia abyssi]|uniref:CocE/NonD family hydrolase n=1 Tax=Svornostia abyssi TaxID=2898438 RepID=A0ABY5PKJ2_9ACTN|nr:CocE/NonD family hydrolase [Parviterribacteraceae bacterium J379]